jgi:hypothetical protein
MPRKALRALPGCRRARDDRALQIRDRRTDGPVDAHRNGRGDGFVEVALAEQFGGDVQARSFVLREVRTEAPAEAVRERVSLRIPTDDDAAEPGQFDARPPARHDAVELKVDLSSAL